MDKRNRIKRQTVVYKPYTHKTAKPLNQWLTPEGYAVFGSLLALVV